MDSLLNAAAHALASGDPLTALRHVALRDDAPALALRGTAMAQLGEYADARRLLRRATRAFGPRESLSRARCVVADAEVALAARELTAATRALDEARRTLEGRGDHANAAHAHLIAVRRLLLLGRVGDARASLDARDWSEAPAPLATIAELARADVALRDAHAAEARDTLERARRCAERAAIPMLVAEVEHATDALDRPAARIVAHGSSRVATIAGVEELFASDRLVVDACRRVIRTRSRAFAFARRPVLFALARTLAESFPGGATRDVLIAHAFGARRPNASHRARLRVELGRLRRELRDVAGIRATARGFELVPSLGRDVVLLLPPVDELDSSLLALLADGTAWSTSALALAHGSSQRTVQRALTSLASTGRVRSIGRARTRRWLATPLTGFTTTLLLPGLPTEG